LGETRGLTGQDRSRPLVSNKTEALPYIASGLQHINTSLTQSNSSFVYPITSFSQTNAYLNGNPVEATILEIEIREAGLMISREQLCMSNMKKKLFSCNTNIKSFSEKKEDLRNKT
jgi:hypothetical protein